jgi:hypothetical protein
MSRYPHAKAVTEDKSQAQNPVAALFVGNSNKSAKTARSCRRTPESDILKRPTSAIRSVFRHHFIVNRLDQNLLQQFCDASSYFQVAKRDGWVGNSKSLAMYIIGALNTHSDDRSPQSDLQ